MTTRRAPGTVLLVGLLILAGCDDAPPDAGPDDAAGSAGGPAARPQAREGERDEGDDGRGGAAHDEADGAEDGPARTAAPPADVAPFTGAEELAEVLATAESALASGELSDGDHAQWAAVQQQAYRDLARHPEWRESARIAVAEELRDAYDLTLHAVEQLTGLTEPREELPDWRIEPPPPVAELRGYYEEAEVEFGVPWQVLAAIHLVETRFGRIHGDSHAGAQGPMQFMPATWEAYGEGDVTDPRDAILAAGRYLAANGAPQDLRAAVHAYNRSDHYVGAVLSHAEAMERHDHYLEVYHAWRVYYRTVDGDVVLEEGYGS